MILEPLTTENVSTKTHVGKKVPAFHTLPLQTVPDPFTISYVQIESVDIYSPFFFLA